jgi:hypothetical protein
MLKLSKTIFILLISVTQLYSQARDSYTTIADGSWSDILSWDNGVPPNDQTGNNDDLVITHNITLTGNLDLKSGTTLIIEGCDTLHVTGDVTFNNGSSIVVQICAVLIIDGSVTNNNNSNDVTINGTIIIAGDYDGGNGSELGGTGSMDIEGSVTTDGDGIVFGSETDCVTDCDNDASSPLPIKLLFFNVNNDDGVVRVEWLTQSENNSDYFEVLVMRDGVSWDLLTTIDAAGNSSSPKFYSVIDENPSYGYNYYKLIQYDYNGDYEIFNTVSNQYVSDKEKKGIDIWPNPSFNQDVSVELVGFKNEIILIIVVDPTGKTFYEKAILSIEDNVIFVIDSKLENGTYLIIGSTRQELYRRKLIVCE